MTSTQGWLRKHFKTVVELCVSCSGRIEQREWRDESKRTPRLKLCAECTADRWNERVKSEWLRKLAYR